MMMETGILEREPMRMPLQGRQEAGTAIGTEGGGILMVAEDHPEGAVEASEEEQVEAEGVIEVEEEEGMVVEELEDEEVEEEEVEEEVEGEVEDKDFL